MTKLLEKLGLLLVKLAILCLAKTNRRVISWTQPMDQTVLQLVSRIIYLGQSNQVSLSKSVQYGINQQHDPTCTCMTYSSDNQGLSRISGFYVDDPIPMKKKKHRRTRVYGGNAHNAHVRNARGVKIKKKARNK